MPSFFELFSFAASRIAASPSSKVASTRRRAVTTICMFAAACGLVPSSSLAALGDCSQPVTNGSSPKASDCLFILNVAVGSQTCEPECVCAPKGQLPPLASDALLCLRKAVAQNVTLNCPCAATTTTTLPPQQPALTAGDFPNVAPCAERDTLPEDAEFQASVADVSGAKIIVNLTAYETKGLPEICGLTEIDNTLAANAIDWDPSRDNALVVCNFFEDQEQLNDFFAMVPVGHGPDLCQTGNNTSTLAMPRAGTYRKDFCIGGEGRAYDLRFRLTVSGPSVDQTYATLGITPGNIEFCDGTREIGTWADAKTFINEDPRNIEFSLKTGGCAAGTVHLNVVAEIICVTERTTSCPAAIGDPGCP